MPMRSFVLVERVLISLPQAQRITDSTYSEDLLGLKFQPAKGCMTETAKSVVRLGLV